MAERYTVRWSPSAIGDLTSIIDRAAADSPDVARRLLDRLETRAAGLRSTPLRGRIVPELSRFAIQDYHELIDRPYRIIYGVQGRTVSVVAVVDGRRDFASLLLSRLITRH